MIAALAPFATASPVPALRELVVDSFAGGGGASHGIEIALGHSPDVAINHDAHAIAMHEINHPGSRHYRSDIWEVDPDEACGGRPVGLLWASPDCKHFSKAKGGKPVDKKIRGLAWVVVKWAARVAPRVIIMENVPEFVTWGPLLETGRPDPARKGETFAEFVAQLKALGYAVDYRTLSAADYGAPTSRRRWFLIARRDEQAIAWPKPTHGPGRPAPYRTAAECIDWSIPCPSIFDRRKPLADATMRRLAEGVRRYVTECPSPFLVQLDGAAAGDRGQLVAAFLAKHNGGTTGQPFDVPMHTITAKDTKRVVYAFLVKYYKGGGQWQGLGEPLHTIVTKARFGLVTVTVAGEPYVIVDIGMRMLEPRELATAQGFGEGYVLMGTKAQQTARIGNSVCPPIAAALVAANLPRTLAGAA